MDIAIQISPHAKSAYFHAYQQVIMTELSLLLPATSAEQNRVGGLEFVYLTVPESILPALLRLSFVQGIYERIDGLLRPIPLASSFALHDDFVFGSKFKGKTNEYLTQLLINVGMHFFGNNKEDIRILDPMCGRGTTLLWALRYGCDGYGIEIDAKAIEDIRRNLKKWTKIHRQKHKIKEGFVGKSNRQGRGKFLSFTAEEKTMKVVIGDSCQSHKLHKSSSFDMIICDVPYGIQHRSSKGARNILSTIIGSLDAWQKSLRPNGGVVLSFNSNLPKRKKLQEAFLAKGWSVMGFAIPHRMSESIVRDVMVCSTPTKSNDNC